MMPEDLDERPTSEQLVDLHVYVVPSELWREHLHSAVDKVIHDTVSIGFIRVYPETSIYSLREDIEAQIGLDQLPREFVFLKCVGRCFTRIRPKQEQTLTARNFIPPRAYAPELFLLDSAVAGPLHSTASSSLAQSQRGGGGVGGGVGVRNGQESSLGNSSLHSEFSPQRHVIPPIQADHRETQTRDDFNRSGSPAVGESFEHGSNAPAFLNTSRLPRSREVGQSLDHGPKAPAFMLATGKDPSSPRKTNRSPVRIGLNGPSQSSPRLSNKGVNTKQTQTSLSEEELEGETNRTGEYDPPLSATSNDLQDTDTDGEQLDGGNRLSLRENEQLQILLKRQNEEKEREIEEQKRRVRAQKAEKLKQERKERELQKWEEDQRRQEAEMQKQAEMLRLKEEEEELLQEAESKRKEAVKRENEKRRKQDELAGAKLKDEQDRAEKKRLEQKKADDDRRNMEEQQNQAKLRELSRNLEDLRAERKKKESDKDSLTQQIKQLNTKANTKRNASDRDTWKKVYFEEKKRTPALDDQCLKLKQAIDSLHRKVLTSVGVGGATVKDASGRVIKSDPSEKTNLRIQAMRVRHDIDDLQGRLETTKMKLTAEMKLRQQAEGDMRDLRNQLSQRKMPAGHGNNAQYLRNVSHNGATPSSAEDE